MPTENHFKYKNREVKSKKMENMCYENTNKKQVDWLY